MTVCPRPGRRRAGLLFVALLAMLAGPVAPAPASAATGVTTVKSASSGSSSSRKSITVKRPSETTAGHVMVAAIASNDDQPGFSAPDGWTLVREDTVPDKLRQAIYVKVAGESEPSSYTWRLTDYRRLAGGITTYAGVDTAHPVDAHDATVQPAKDDEVPAPAISTTVPGAMLIHIAAINAEGKLYPQSGMTKRWRAVSPNKKKAADAQVLLSDTQLPDAGDTGGRTATGTKAGPSIGALLALRPAPGLPTPPPTDPPPPPPGAEDPVLVGAGDIAHCADNTGAAATAKLLDDIPGTVFTLGDNAYVDGTAQEYDDCYEPTWGRHKARTAFAVAGNHDYNTDGASGFYNYFGAAAGDPAKGYYDARLGSWHVIVLNSNCEEIGGCGAGSPQEQWLRSVLATSTARCTVALWHHPMFSSGSVHRAFPTYQPFWQALHDHGADVVLVGSDHFYERFGLQDAAGDADPDFGLRQFTVGTGGRSHQSFKAPAPNSEVRNGSAYGVLALSLHEDSYDWRFVPTAGQTFTDQGSAACHGVPTPPAPDPGPIVRHGQSNHSATASRSLTLPRPANTAADQVLLASIVSSDDEMPAAPEGWTRLRSDAIPGKLRQTIYLRVAEDGEPSGYMWTVPERRQLAGGIAAYSGVDLIDPVEVHDADVHPTAGTAITGPSLPASLAGGMVVHFAAVNAEGTLVPPPGLRQRWLAPAPVAATTDVLVGSFDGGHAGPGPAGPVTATATEPGGRIAATLALRPVTHT